MSLLAKEFLFNLTLVRLRIKLNTYQFENGLKYKDIARYLVQNVYGNRTPVHVYIVGITFGFYLYVCVAGLEIYRTKQNANSLLL